MTDSDYITKLREIRKQLSDSHRTLVDRYPLTNPRSELDQIISTYQAIEALDRIIAAEEARAG